MINFIYGYGKQYRQTVKDLLKKDGIDEINGIKIDEPLFYRNFNFFVKECKQQELKKWS